MRPSYYVQSAVFAAPAPADDVMAAKSGQKLSGSMGPGRTLKDKHGRTWALGQPIAPVERARLRALFFVPCQRAGMVAPQRQRHELIMVVVAPRIVAIDGG